jgi:MSHA biogenesis protein MshQ
MHCNTKRHTYWGTMLFVLACLGWQNHTLASSECLATDNGIYGEEKLKIESGVTMNGFSVNSGDTYDNSISSTGAINNPSITLTSLGSVTFGSNDIKLGNNDTLSPGSYREVEVKKNSSITMQGGDYYIDNFNIKENVSITLLGPVTMHVGEFDLDDDVEMNGPYNNTNPVTTDGDASNLTINWYGDGKFHLHDDVKFTGIIYSAGVGGNEELQIKEKVKFFGGIFTDNVIKIEEDAEFTYGPSEQAAAAAVLNCETNTPNQCSAVFPDGASTHSSSGIISFGSNSQLFGSDDNQLATTSISKNGASFNTCNTVDCAATGTPSVTIPTVNFQTTSSTVDVTLNFRSSVVIGSGSYSGNEFNDINPNSASEADITFANTHGVYFVDRLILGFDNTLYLRAGASYWINQLTIGSEADIIVQGSGTAFIYVNQNLSFPSPSLINSPSSNNSGDASKLVMYASSDVTFNNNSTYTGSLYAQGDLFLTSASYAFGSVSAANINLGSASTITYQNEEIADTDFGAFCTDNVIAPYQITGHRKSITGDDDWSWNGSYIVDWRAAMEDTNNFGQGGVVSQAIKTVDLSILNASSLTTVDAFVGTWWSSSQSVSYHSMLRDFFLGGGDLVLLQDDNTHDGIGEFLGIETISGMSNPTTISSPLQDGSFGTVGSITVNVGSNHLNNAQITALGGTICGVDQSGQATFACWEEGEYAPGAGKLVIVVDTEFVTTESNEANFSNLNDKGKLALNILEFLISTPPTPLPLIEYRFDELSWTGSVGEVIDSSGNNNNGTALGGITTALGKICNAADIPNNNSATTFEAVDTGVDLDTVIGSSGTISLWYRSDSAWNSGTKKRLFDATKGDKYFFAEIGSDARVKFFFEDGDDGDYQKITDNSFSVGAGVWKHLTFVWDITNTTAKILVDGVEQNISNSNNHDPGTAAVTGLDTLYFGDNRDESYFTGETSADGLIDEALVFDFVLTPNQILTIFNNQDAGNNYDGTTRSCPINTCGKLNAVAIRIDDDGSDNQITTTTEALAIHAAWQAAGSPASGLIDGGTYNVAASGSNTVDRIDFGGDLGSFTGTLPYPNIGSIGDDSFSDFLVHTSGTLSLPAGDYTLYIEGDDGFNLVLNTLTGNTVSFNKFSGSNNDAGASNELRFEGTTGNVRTGGSFTLTEDSSFDIATIFFERNGSDFLEISIANDILTSTSTSDYEILRDGAIGGKVVLGQCAALSQVDHYRILHDTQGFTCEPETLTIKACADANCDAPYEQETSISLSPSGWAGSDTIVFTGETTTSLNVTDEGTVTMAKVSASPEAGLRCFSGSTETCDITFSNDGFEIYGASIGDLLSDQLAASNFLNVNLRAVRSNNNVCEALLAGTQDIDLTYDCDSPNQCLTPLSGISIMGDGTGGNTGSIEVEFNDQGVASLAVLNYPDAGRLTLSIQAEVEGVTVTNSDNETVDVYPSYLQLAVEQSELLYANSGEQNNYVAGLPFNVSIGAYGINDALLPNYQAENPQLKVNRAQPDSSGVNGIFKYSDSGSSSAQLAASFTAASGLNFSDGEHQYALAYYDEVGRINVDVKDNTYLGNEILSSGSLTLGDFYPAYFDVIATVQPTLADTCGVFSYIGQSVGFETSPQLTVTAYNALDEITENYSGAYWSYLPDELTLEANLSYLDSSTYTSEGTASEVELGDAPVVSDNANYDGSGTVTIYNGLFQYNKVDTNKSAFNLVSPFDGSINLMFANGFFSTTFTGQTGSNTICYQDNYANASCNSLGIVNVIGTEIRYGRLELPSTYGPKTESLVVPIQAQYYDAGQWLLNTDDNCTSIAFDENADHIVLEPSGSADITGDINNISSTGTLLLGVADDGNDLLLNAPGIEGEVELQLNPNNDATGWSNHLNYDWNADTLINADDQPKATVTFGQFRGNDRIIHWREVFD